MKFLWPIAIFLSVLAAGLVNFIAPDFVGRPLIMAWFLLICPGMVLTRFFQFKEPALIWSFAVALSLVVDMSILGIQVYSGHWSPSIALLIIMGICITGTLLQLVQKTILRTY